MLIKYREIFKLMNLLDKNKIKYEFYDRCQADVYGKGKHFIHFQIIINQKNKKERAFSIIEGFGTYGEEEDKLEIMNYFDNSMDNVLGYLSAKEVLSIIKKYNNQIEF